MSETHKRNIGLANKKAPHLSGEKATHWKGDKVKYFGIHEWLKNNFGSAN